MAILIASCTEPVELSCDIFSLIEGEIAPTEMTIFPDAILESASELSEQVEADKSLVGFWGSFGSRIAGTEAYSLSVKIASIKRLLAYQTSLEQVVANGGKPLVDMSDDRICEVLAARIASVDQSQSSEQFLSNVKAIQAYYGPGYSYRNRTRTK